MEKLILIEYSKADMISWMEIRVTDGTMKIKHGDSIKVTQVKPPSQEQIDRVRRLRWTQVASKAAWYDAIDWLLTRLSLKDANL